MKSVTHRNKMIYYYSVSFDNHIHFNEPVYTYTFSRNIKKIKNNNYITIIATII